MSPPRGFPRSLARRCRRRVHYVPCITERPGIYTITHRASGRHYVGSAQNISKRWSAHRKALRAGNHRNAHLQASWAKYGENAFAFCVAELTDELDAREQFWIDVLDAFHNGFNLCPVARSSRGRKWSAAERASREAAAAARGVPLARHLNTGPTLDKRIESNRRRMRAARSLTPAQVRDIRVRYGTPTGGRGRRHARKGGTTLAQLGAEYGLSAPTICEIVGRKLYADIA